jgi:hypothetical protein
VKKGCEFNQKRCEFKILLLLLLLLLFLLAKFLRTGDCFSSQLLIFSQKKNWKNLGEMCFSSENLTNFANVFENGSIMVSNTRG